MNEFVRKAMELANEMADWSCLTVSRGSALGAAGAIEANEKCQAARSALLAHLEGGEQKWLPIETAPKDGTSILFGYRSGFSEEGRWMGDAARNHWGETGWFATSDDVLCDHPSAPDLWMHLPLPATPTEDESK